MQRPHRCLFCEVHAQRASSAVSSDFWDTLPSPLLKRSGAGAAGQPRQRGYRAEYAQRSSRCACGCEPLRDLRADWQALPVLRLRSRERRERLAGLAEVPGFPHQRLKRLPHGVNLCQLGGCPAMSACISRMHIQVAGKRHLHIPKAHSGGGGGGPVWKRPGNCMASGASRMKHGEVCITELLLDSTHRE